MFGARYRPEILTQAVIAAVAGILLFWGLSDRYLWQDEAQTAVLATRMLQFGKPLAYDGVNLLGSDLFDPDDDAVGRLAGDPKTAVDYHARRREFKPDTTWTWQPWGLFAVAAVGLKLLGLTTLGARLPFALAGLATVLLLFRLVRKYSGSLTMATLAALFLSLGPYWILHARQCRYYSLSNLFLVLTFMGYARWQAGERGGMAAFVAAAWGWFQVDYGTVWPVFAVLFLDAFLARRLSLRRCATAGAVLAATLAPFFYFYDLAGRQQAGPTHAGWRVRFWQNLFNMNEYLTPALIVLAAVALLAWRWKSIDPGERQLTAVAAGTILSMVLWVPTVSVYAFLRYAIVVAPAGALLTAWVVVRVFSSRAARFAWPAAALLIVTPWASLPLHALAPTPAWYAPSPWVRGEFSVLETNLLGDRPDPNRLVIEWLRDNAKPSDEILINYEDFPLMFYLPNPVRGGIFAFRVEDDARTPPRFLVLRRSVNFVNWPIFRREARRYQWAPVALKAPDIPWGNLPDPLVQSENADEAPDLLIARRIGP